MSKFMYEDISEVVFHEPDVKKHGSHNQKTHGRKGGGGGEASVDAVRAVNDESFREANDWNKYNVNDRKKLTDSYDQQYAEGTEENVNAEFQVEDYATSGYQGINAVARGKQKSDTYMENKISILDKTIEESPDVFGDKNLYRVTEDSLLEGLDPGDVFIDKGFMSTTRTNVTKNATLRNALGEIGSGVDTVTVILPSPSKSGKGLAVDTFLTSRGRDGTGEFWGKESEVLLPRDTALLFLGMSTSTDHQGKPIAIFQRMDK
jgi:hypothetical protein